MSERRHYLREQEEQDASEEGVRYLDEDCETCALRSGADDVTGAFAVDDERFCGECNRSLGVDVALRAKIDAGLLEVLREATLHNRAHGVSTLWPLTAEGPSASSPGGHLKRETIQAALERLEAAGLARRDGSGFDHLEKDEDGWWRVMTDDDRVTREPPSA